MNHIDIRMSSHVSSIVQRHNGQQQQHLRLTDEQKSELMESFKGLDNNGHLDLSELKSALDLIGIKLPQWQVRQMIDDMEKGKGPVPVTARKQGGLSFKEFEQLCSDLRSKDVALTFKNKISKKENVQTLGGMSEASSAGTTHSVRHEEQVAFSDWINRSVLCPHTHLPHYRPAICGAPLSPSPATVLLVTCTLICRVLALLRPVAQRPKIRVRPYRLVFRDNCPTTCQSGHVFFFTTDEDRPIASHCRWVTGRCVPGVTLCVTKGKEEKTQLAVKDKSLSSSPQQPSLPSS